mmetsp:Transcript_10411/g.30632  ORF Transcript_10411/g.30632 Transcript_10411/m.30632 type:complete len:259 (+) Transcript_10411:858-1634(+)
MAKKCFCRLSRHMSRINRFRISGVILSTSLRLAQAYHCNEASSSVACVQRQRCLHHRCVRTTQKQSFLQAMRNPFCAFNNRATYNIVDAARCSVRVLHVLCKKRMIWSVARILFKFARFLRSRAKASLCLRVHRPVTYNPNHLRQRADPCDRFKRETHFASSSFRFCATCLYACDAMFRRVISCCSRSFLVMTARSLLAIVARLASASRLLVSSGYSTSRFSLIKFRDGSSTIGASWCCRSYSSSRSMSSMRPAFVRM